MSTAEVCRCGRPKACAHTVRRATLTTLAVVGLVGYWLVKTSVTVGLLAAAVS